MRSLLTSGIKAILAVAALSTGVHWALRLQRDSDGLTTPAIASLADPETTGSIASRASVPPAAAVPASPMPAAGILAAEMPAAKISAAKIPAAKIPAAQRPAVARAPQTTGLDQSRLAALMANAGAPTPKTAAKR